MQMRQARKDNDKSIALKPVNAAKPWQHNIKQALKERNLAMRQRINLQQ